MREDEFVVIKSACIYKTNKPKGKRNKSIVFLSSELNILVFIDVFFIDSFTGILYNLSSNKQFTQHRDLMNNNTQNPPIINSNIDKT